MAEPKPLLAPLRPVSRAARLWTAVTFAADRWRSIADDAEFPIEGHGIISLQRWRAEQPARAATTLAIGIRVAPAESLDPAIDRLDRLGLIALSFAKFTDGRAYSTARRLREQWRFRGEIRATGDVLLDQLPLMLRSGFDAFEIVDAATLAALEQGNVPAVSRTYQRNIGEDRLAWRARHAAAPQMTAAE
jgi:uncharacterized protein (DUF934 family)